MLFTEITTPYTAYDSTKTNLGQWIQQKTGSNWYDKYVGPFPISVTRPMEASTQIPGIYPHVIDWGNNLHWVFLADNAAAAATRRIVCYTFNTSTQAWSWRGWINLTYPSATNHTIRGMRVARHLYTTGTVAVSGTAVTGTTTAWQTARFAVGARIGFGTTDPTQVSTWYYISAMASDTGITLSASAGSIAGGTSFVIEELRVYTVTTNATAANGGLFVAKGINFNDFISTGTAISAAVSTDNVKAVFWLKDASTVTNTAAGTLCLGGTAATNTNQDIYVLNANTGTSASIFKYNGRAALTVASGASTNALTLITGTQATTGTISQTNSGRIGTLNHGPGSGTSCMYFATTTRVYRVIESGITAASTSFLTDAMIEIPPGTVNTYAATGAMTSVEIASSIDRLIITTGAAQKHYITQYNTTSSQLDKVIFCDNKQIDQTTADANAFPFPSTQSAGFSVWSENGITYFARTGATAIINQLYALPLSADWDFAAGTSAALQNRLITPEISTPGCTKFSRLYTNEDKIAGSENLGLPTEAFRSYYRTSGISDDSGSWTLINENGDLTGTSGSNSIQFMFEFKVMGITCIPARLYGFTITWEDDSTDSHYQPSIANSSLSAKRFAWRFSTTFGGTVPRMKIMLYDATTGSSLLTDDTVSEASGTFEKSTNDGSSWGTYDTTDKANETTYIRYTPTSIADNTKVRAVLLQY